MMVDSSTSSKLSDMDPTLYAPTAVMEKKPSFLFPQTTTLQIWVDITSRKFKNLSFKDNRLGISFETQGEIGNKVPTNIFQSSSSMK